MARPSRREYRQMQEEFDRIEAENARKKAEAALAQPLTRAEIQARWRARKRGEPVEYRRPGPKTAADRTRAALIDAQAENLMLREQVSELETENGRLADGNKRLRKRIGRLEEQIRVLEEALADGAETA
jgi:hypothetical protein